MPLILTITQTRGGHDRQTRTLAQGTLTIGRASGNDWVLADPDQHLSRTHCMVAFEGGRYVLTDLSTNGLLINGAREPTARNSRTVLTDGDTVQLGSYRLEVAEADGPATGASSSPFGASSFIAPRSDPFTAGGSHDGDGPLDVDPLDDPLERPAGVGFDHPMPHAPPSLRVEDPFDIAAGGRQQSRGFDEDLFRGKTADDAWKGPVQHDVSDAGSHAYSAPRPITPVNIDEIDFDALLGDVMPTPSAHPLDPPKPSAAAPMPAPFAESLDDLLGEFPITPAGASIGSSPAGASPAGSFEEVPGPPPGPPSTAAVPPAIPAVTPSITSPAAAQPAATPVATVPSGTAAPAALLAAFLDGAGVSQLDLSAQEPEAAMRALGELFRAFASGTRDVLMSRAEIKHEMRVEQTMIRSRDNNALKFSVSPEEALIALLQPSRPGYKAPLDAVKEAFNDIRSHEMAVMAGLQTALIALLKRFDPVGLEARLQRGMLDGIMPGSRKARFWELFCATYKEIAHEAEDDFHSIFGREFARAYDAQVRKL